MSRTWSVSSRRSGVKWWPKHCESSGQVLNVSSKKLYHTSTRLFWISSRNFARLGAWGNETKWNEHECLIVYHVIDVIDVDHVLDLEAGWKWSISPLRVWPQAHIFHGVKTLTSDLREMSEVSSSFLLAKKGIGAALVPLMPSQGSQGSATTQVDNLWIKLVDTMRLEVWCCLPAFRMPHEI